MRLMGLRDSTVHTHTPLIWADFSQHFQILEHHRQTLIIGGEGGKMGEKEGRKEGEEGGGGGKEGGRGLGGRAMVTMSCCHPKSVHDDIPQRLAQTPCPVCRR